MSRKVKREVNAAYEMGRLEARVSVKDETLTASDFIKYFINCERAGIVANNSVMKYLQDNNYLESGRLVKVYSSYKSRYWKADKQF